MSKIKFISIETDSHNRVERKLLHSCNIHNIDIQIIGKGASWEGFVTKFKIMVEYLSQISDEIVCLTDSRDVLYMSDENTIYNTFIENFDKDTIVFNGETQCFPEPEFAELHPHQNKKYKYLNSGCVIGSRLTLLEAAKKAIELYEKTEINDDQFLIQKLLIDNKLDGKITLDYECKIFQCVWDNDWGRSNNFDLIYSKDDIYNRLTETHPLIFHFPGPTTTDSQVWKILNGEYSKVVTNKFF
jgi:hypothetical protein|tara:strand:- start:30 stop:758 length:729 start_codon:yes stop_codon:yes gene_type:complete